MSRIKTFRMKQLSHKNRAPAPILPRDHILSAQVTPHSNITSASSQFLTPPVFDHYVSSPPPQADAEDYLDATQRPKHKGRHKVRRLRKQNNNKEGSEETASSTQGLLRSETSAYGSPRSYCLSCDSKNELGELSRPAQTSMKKGRTFPAQLSSGSSASWGPSRLRRANTRLSVAFPPEQAGSPALNSLRGLSQSGEKPQYSVLRRLSRTFTSTLGISPPAHLDTENQSLDHKVRVESGRPF